MARQEKLINDHFAEEGPPEGVSEMLPLLPKQQVAYNHIMRAEPDSTTILGYGGSVGSGKSVLNARFALELSLAFPGTRILVARKTLESLKTTTREEFFRQCPTSLIYKKNETEQWVKLRNSKWPHGVVSTIFFRGIEDYQSKGSEAFQIVIIDEAHEVSKEAAEFFLTRLRWQLPKVVKDRMAMQCRFLFEYPGTNALVRCGKICQTLSCPEHGTEWMGNGIRYFLIATANPWPGWFADWFHKGELGSATSHLPDTKVHFVQALPTDNPFLPPGYIDMLRATMSPDMVKRLVEGQFDVFAGLIFEAFYKDVHCWGGPIPPYTRVIGGLDFGQESTTAHFTAGLVILVTQSGRLLLVDEFKDRGPGVYQRQAEWMAAMNDKWAKPLGKGIEWVADRSQSVGARNMRRDGVSTIQISKGGPGSLDAGIMKVAEYLNKRPDGYPGLLYLPGGYQFEGVPAGCGEWEKEIREYSRDPKTMKVIERNDDLMACTRYALELVSSMSGDPSVIFKSVLPTVA